MRRTMGDFQTNSSFDGRIVSEADGQRAQVEEPEAHRRGGGVSSRKSETNLRSFQTSKY